MGLEEELKEEGCTWVSVNGFAICLETSDSGVLVEIYNEALLDAGEPPANALLAKVGAHASELRRG